MNIWHKCVLKFFLAKRSYSEYFPGQNILGPNILGQNIRAEMSVAKTSYIPKMHRYVIVMVGYFTYKWISKSFGI